MDASTGTLIMILCYVFGTGLIMMEAFMPGFGIAGIAGIILEITAVVLTSTHFGTTWAIIATLIVLLFIGIAVFISYRSAMKGRLSKSDLVLKDAQHPDSDQARKALSPFVGREGVVATPLRPAGQIEIDGRRVSAASGGEFLEKGTRIRVTGTEGDHVLVRSED